MAIQLTNNDSANIVFDLVNQAEAFGDQKIDIILINTDPWFKGKNVAAILGYDNTTKSIRDNIDIDDRATLESCICGVGTGDTYRRFNKNELKTIYINESGLYSLILNSKLPSAKKFKKWVTSDLLPKIRKTGQEKYLLQLAEKDKQLQEKDEQLNYMHNIQKELLSYKKRVTRDEIVYIVSTAAYSCQGIFKIGRTKKEMKFRSSTHNTTHVAGDKVVSLREFLVHDCAAVEKNIHNKLKGLLLDGEHEFFMCPYDLLVSIVELIVDNDDGENQEVNRIIDVVYNLKQHAFKSVEWTAGLNMGIFTETIQMIEQGENKVLATFNITNATEAEKQAFVKRCIVSYQQTIQRPNDEAVVAAATIAWKAFQGYLIQQLNIPKSKFKAMVWRSLVKKEEDANTGLFFFFAEVVFGMVRFHQAMVGAPGDPENVSTPYTIANTTA
jgi:prophage antirepressor-like protein